MKKAVCLTWILGLALNVALGEAVIGKAAPKFELKDVEGNTQSLAQYKGKIVVLENYNLDCPFVQNHYKSGAMQALQTEATGKGVVWLVVNSSYGDAAKAKKEQTSQKMKATAVIHDPSGVIGRSYGFKTTPHMIIIDKQGLVAYDGAIDDKPATSGDPRQAHNYVRAALQELLAGEPVAKAQTKPYGCGAKYSKSGG